MEPCQPLEASHSPAPPSSISGIAQLYKWYTQHTDNPLLTASVQLGFDGKVGEVAINQDMVRWAHLCMYVRRINRRSLGNFSFTGIYLCFFFTPALGFDMTFLKPLFLRLCICFTAICFLADVCFLMFTPRSSVSSRPTAFQVALYCSS